MASVEKSVYGKLSGTSAVTDLVSTRIYPHMARQGDSLPYVTYFIVSSVPLNASTGSTDTVQTTIQIDVWAASASSAKAIADAIFTALDGYNDATNAVSYYTMQARRQEMDAPEDGSQRPIYRESMDWDVWHNN